MGGLDADGVHHGVDGHARKGFLFLQGYAEAVECVEKLRVDFIEAFGAFGLGARLGVVADGLVVDRRNVEMGPGGHFECLPVAEGFQTEFEEPLRLALFC